MFFYGASCLLQQHQSHSITVSNESQSSSDVSTYEEKDHWTSSSTSRLMCLLVQLANVLRLKCNSWELFSWTKLCKVSLLPRDWCWHTLRARRLSRWIAVNQHSGLLLVHSLLLLLCFILCSVAVHTCKCRLLTMFKTIQTPSIMRHRKEVTIPKLRNTIAAVSWRRNKEKRVNERISM